MPERGAVGIEIPLFFFEILLPLHFDNPAILTIRYDGANGLDGHTRNRMVMGIKRKILSLCASRFDGDFVADLHNFDIAQKAIGIAINPNAFRQKILGLVGGVVVGGAGLSAGRPDSLMAVMTSPRE